MQWRSKLRANGPNETSAKSFTWRWDLIGNWFWDGTTEFQFIYSIVSCYNGFFGPDRKPKAWNPQNFLLNPTNEKEPHRALSSLQEPNLSIPHRLWAPRCLGEASDQMDTWHEKHSGLCLPMTNASTLTRPPFSARSLRICWGRVSEVQVSLGKTSKSKNQLSATWCCEEFPSWKPQETNGNEGMRFPRTTLRDVWVHGPPREMHDARQVTEKASSTRASPGEPVSEGRLRVQFLFWLWFLGRGEYIV